MVATEETNREGGPPSEAYSRRAGNNGARVYARLAWRVYAKTASQENDRTQSYFFGHWKRVNDGGSCGVSEIKEGKIVGNRESGRWMVLPARTDGRTARGMRRRNL